MVQFLVHYNALTAHACLTAAQCGKKGEPHYFVFQYILTSSGSVLQDLLFNEVGSVSSHWYSHGHGRHYVTSYVFVPEPC